jgi:L-asparaginase
LSELKPAFFIIEFMKIKFYATGGTIDKVYFDAKSEYQVGAPQVEEILKGSNVAFEYEVESILQKDSLEMTDQDRRQIREIIENEPCDKIVITHGTDTMTETAKFLLGIEKKTIVFTGAMEPARSRYTDATFNVGCAIGAVQALSAGVYIAMNGSVYEADKVQKNYDAKRFESIW